VPFQPLRWGGAGRCRAGVGRLQPLSLRRKPDPHRRGVRPGIRCFARQSECGNRWWQAGGESRDTFDRHPGERRGGFATAGWPVIQCLPRRGIRARQLHSSASSKRMKPQGAGWPALCAVEARFRRSPGWRGRLKLRSL